MKLRSTQIKTEITPEEVFATLSRLTPTNTGYKALCPNPEHKDTKLGNFHINLSKGYMKCFSCGWSKSVFDFLIEGGVSFAEAYKFFIEPRELENREVLFPIAIGAPKEFLDRGFTKETLEHFKVGYSEHDGRIEIPVIFYDKVVGVVYRKPGKKLFSNDGFLMHDFIYNYEPTEERYFTEGFTDVFRTYQNGVENISATMGVSITPKQLALMRRHKVIHLGYDYDYAGVSAMYHIYYSLRDYVDINVLPFKADLGDKNDLGNCSKVSIEKAVKRISPFVNFDIAFQQRQPELYEKIKKELTKGRLI